MRRALLVGVPILVLGAIVVANQYRTRYLKVPGTEKKAPAFEVRFEAPSPPRLNEPVPVTLLIQGNPVGWSPDMEGEGRWEILLRLPIGIRLNTPGWKPVEPTPAERSDPSGPWLLFLREQPIRLPATVTKGQAVAQESISLIIVEEGLNWIISSRVRLIRGQETWQSFGLILATLREGEAEFHTVPKRA